MTIEDLLAKFTPRAAGEAAGLCKSAGYHWYNPKRNIIPSETSIMKLATAAGLDRDQTDSVLLDALRRRMQKMAR